MNAKWKGVNAKCKAMKISVGSRPRRLSHPRKAGKFTLLVYRELTTWENDKRKKHRQRDFGLVKKIRGFYRIPLRILESRDLFVLSGMIPCEVIADDASKTTSVEPHCVLVESTSTQWGSTEVGRRPSLPDCGSLFPGNKRGKSLHFCLRFQVGGQVKQNNCINSRTLHPRRIVDARETCTKAIYGISFASSRLSAPFWSQGFEKKHREKLAVGYWEASGWSKWLIETPVLQWGFQRWFL